MFWEFQAPPRAEAFSDLIKKRLEEVKGSGGTRETVTVDWNGQSLHVEVVDLPLESLYYNPGTHRIRAQRSHDPVRDQVLTDDPWNVESQGYLQELLKANPENPNERDSDFDKLKESLQEFGQNDPGLVTHHGVIVNGNTRAAALREIHQPTMRVGVLPASFTWADINAVELSLQLRKDHRRDYSYINRLLAMEEQAGLGRTPEQIAREFRIHTKTYHQERWILTSIRELIQRSRTGNAILRLVDFEGDQEKLKELERLYKKHSQIDPDQAEVIKEMRFSAILLDFAKTDVRHIDEHFVKADYLTKNLPENLREGSVGGVQESDSLEIPGLGVSVDGPVSDVVAARAVTDRILRAKAVAGMKSDSGFSDGERWGANELYEDAKTAFDKAIDVAGRDARVRKRKQLAPARLADACASIDQCVVELVQARTSRSFDEEAFDDAVLVLRASLSRLAQQAKRTQGEPGDGVSWLIDAVSGARP